MAEEAKQQNKGNLAGTLFKVVLGLVFLALGGFLVYRWFGDLKIVVKGCLGPFLLLVGIITLAIAKE